MTQLKNKEVEIVGKLHPQVQDKWRQERALKESLLGYAILDLIEHSQSLVFGRWNPRQLKTAHIKRLLVSFDEDGLERFDEKSVIPVVLKKTLVDLSTLTQDLSDIHTGKLPQLQFSASQSNTFSIPCASGRHRHEALGRYLEEVQKKNDVVEKKREAISNLPNDALTDEDVDYFNKGSVKELQHYGGILKYGGQWLVAVYDESKQLFLVLFLIILIFNIATLLADGIELAQYLSQNETKHVYMQTDEERIIMEIQLLATLTVSKREERLKELRSGNMTKKANPLVTVVNSEAAFKSAETLINCCSHFLDMAEMSVKWLYRELCGLHGGVSEHALVVSIY